MNFSAHGPSTKFALEELTKKIKSSYFSFACPCICGESEKKYCELPLNHLIHKIANSDLKSISHFCACSKPIEVPTKLKEQRELAYSLSISSNPYLALDLLLFSTKINDSSHNKHDTVLMKGIVQNSANRRISLLNNTEDDNWMAECEHWPMTFSHFVRTAMYKIYPMLHDYQNENISEFTSDVCSSAFSENEITVTNPDRRASRVRMTRILDERTYEFLIRGNISQSKFGIEGSIVYIASVDQDVQRVADSLHSVYPHVKISKVIRRSLATTASGASSPSSHLYKISCFSCDKVRDGYLRGDELSSCINGTSPMGDCRECELRRANSSRRLTFDVIGAGADIQASFFSKSSVLPDLLHPLTPSISKLDNEKRDTTNQTMSCDDDSANFSLIGEIISAKKISDGRHSLLQIRSVFPVINDSFTDEMQLDFLADPHQNGALSIQESVNKSEHFVHLNTENLIDPSLKKDKFFYSYPPVDGEVTVTASTSMSSLERMVKQNLERIKNLSSQHFYDKKKSSSKTKVAYPNKAYEDNVFVIPEGAKDSWMTPLHGFVPRVEFYELGALNTLDTTCSVNKFNLNDANMKENGLFVHEEENKFVNNPSPLSFKFTNNVIEDCYMNASATNYLREASQLDMQAMSFASFNPPDVSESPSTHEFRHIPINVSNVDLKSHNLFTNKNLCDTITMPTSAIHAENQVLSSNSPPHDTSVIMDILSSLNESQAAVVEDAVMVPLPSSSAPSRVILVEGPPGTGKSRTIAGMLEAFHKINSTNLNQNCFSKPRRIFLTSATHVAIEAVQRQLRLRNVPYIPLSDAIFQLKKSDLPDNELRIFTGTVFQVANFMSKDSTTTNTSSHTRWADVMIMDEAAKLDASSSLVALLASATPKLPKIMGALADLEMRPRGYSGTQNQMKSRLEGKLKHLGVISSEKSFSSMTWDGSIMLPRLVVLVGDEKQLSCNEGVSLFSLLLRHPYVTSKHLLNTQYRMNPRLALFSSYAFYGGHLKSAESTLRPPPYSLPSFNCPSPIIFIDTSIPFSMSQVNKRLGLPLQDAIFSSFHAAGKQQREMGSSSRTNPLEAKVVALVTETFLKAGIPSKDVIVVTPYIGQQKALLRAIHGNDNASDKKLMQLSMSFNGGSSSENSKKIISRFQKPPPEGCPNEAMPLNLSLTHEIPTEGSENFQLRTPAEIFASSRASRLLPSAFASNGGLSNGQTLEPKVLTVDAMQGSESPVVIFSAVRTNQLGDLGFLGDLRRMNVLLTRAQHSLVVVGDGATLAKGGGLWALWYEHMRRSGCIVGVDTALNLQQASNLQLQQQYHSKVPVTIASVN